MVEFLQSHKGLPLPVASNPEVHVAVPRFEERDGCKELMCVSPPGDFYVVRHAERQMGRCPAYGTLEKREINPSALARELSLEERFHDLTVGTFACPHVDDRNADAHRFSVGLPIQFHEASPGLNDRVISRFKHLRSVTCQPEPDDVFSYGMNRLVIDAKNSVVLGHLVCCKHIDFQFSQQVTEDTFSRFAF